jgi:hypothetical protein
MLKVTLGRNIPPTTQPGGGTSMARTTHWMANLGCPKMGISPQALAVQMENRLYPLDLGGSRIFGQTQIMVGFKSYI